MEAFGASRNRGQIPAPLNPDLMLVGVRACFRALYVHSQRVCFPTGSFLFAKHQASLICLNVVFNGLKPAMSRGYRA